jgi:hypothetical protein
MALKSYILTQDFKSPYVRVTGRPEKPQQICFKNFKKGEVINGELKHDNNKPAFVLVKGTLAVPLSVIKELVTKDVVNPVDETVTSSAEGAPKKEGDAVKKDGKETSGKITIASATSKVKYIDAIVIGGIVGFAGVYLAEKQNWITSVDNKNKVYGAVGGALAALYVVYRIKNK